MVEWLYGERWENRVWEKCNSGGFNRSVGEKYREVIELLPLRGVGVEDQISYSYGYSCSHSHSHDHRERTTDDPTNLSRQRHWTAEHSTSRYVNCSVLPALNYSLSQPTLSQCDHNYLKLSIEIFISLELTLFVIQSHY